MTRTVGIVGAGILGRLTALELAGRGWRVTLFDRGDPEGSGACSFAAAGMLAPYAELETGEHDLCRQGEAALERWPVLLDGLPAPVFFQREGTLVVAHPADRAELHRLRDRVRAAVPHALTEVRVADLEPEIDPRFSEGLFFPGEGQLDNRALLAALAQALPAAGVDCRFHTEVTHLAPGLLQAEGTDHRFAWVVDCGGLSSRRYLPDLRGVRGECLLVTAPAVRLTRPVRLIHPRYPLYLVPRPGNRFIIGATCVESEDERPLTVRSALELLSAAFALHPGFAEGWIERSFVDRRPAFPDNLPQLRTRPGLLQANGLYRHGFLLSPLLAPAIADRLEAA